MLVNNQNLILPCPTFIPTFSHIFLYNELIVLQLLLLPAKTSFSFLLVISLQLFFKGSLEIITSSQKWTHDSVLTRQVYHLPVQNAQGGI